MKTYEVLKHPADLKIRVWGKNLPQLFVNAGRAMAEQQAVAGEKKREEVIELKSDDLSSLLVDWLGELLSLGDVNQVVYTEFEIGKLSEREIGSRAYGRSVKEKKLDIKAVTYHEAEVKKTKEGWKATIVFDI